MSAVRPKSPFEEGDTSDASPLDELICPLHEEEQEDEKDKEQEEADVIDDYESDE